jgi:hypothetical protein
MEMPLGSLPSDWSSCGVHDVKGKGEMVSVCLTIHVFLCECCGQKGCKELRALGRDGGGLKQIRAFPGLCSHVEETLCSATSGGTPTENHLHTPKIKAIRFFFLQGHAPMLDKTCTRVCMHFLAQQQCVGLMATINTDVWCAVCALCVSICGCWLHQGRILLCHSCPASPA